MKRYRVPPHKKGAWFVPIRGSYLPVTWEGWLISIPYISYLVISLLYVVDRAQEPGDIIINLVPYWLSAAVAMTWIAKQKS
jgi:hypothetical protein